MRRAKPKADLGTEQARRVIYMYNKFLEGNSYSSSEMYDEVIRVFKVNLSLRTVQRDLRTLHEMIPNMEQVNVGRQVYWRLIKEDLAPKYLENIDASDIISLHYLKGYLSQFKQSLVGKDAEKMIKKADAFAPGKVFLPTATNPNYENGRLNYKNFSAIFEDIVNATIEQKWLNVSYNILFDSEIHHHFVMFKGFFNYNNSLCFIGYIPRRHKYAIIPMENIIKTVPALPYNEFVPDFDLRAFFENRFGINDGELVVLTVKFAPEYQRVWGHRTWHPNQITKTNEDGSVEITFNVIFNKELLIWLMKFGPAVKVLSPQIIVDALKQEYQAALNQY